MARARASSDKRKARNDAAKARAASAQANRVESPLPTPRRTKTGLQWLLQKREITQAQFLLGERIGSICIEASRAENPCSRDLGAPHVQTSTSPTLAPWRIAAICERRRLVEGLSRSLGDEAQGVLLLLDWICGFGMTPREVADGDDREAIRIIARLKLGLAVCAIILGATSRHTTTEERAA